ncbi:MAG: DUF4329 domain-containing protein, partial [Clostridia bacterium]|nr:DUF4329 domain-containing protein [Clostridia bacterium]
TLTKDSKWKYTFTVTASKEWINEENRAFPITIDPTVVTSASVDTCVLSNDNTDYNTASVMVIGNFWGSVDSTAFVKFNSLPQIPSGYTLADAKAVFFVSVLDNSSNVDFSVGVYEATEEWAQYNDEKGVYETQVNHNNRYDYFDEGSPVDCVKITSTGIKKWNITSLYEKWVSGITNYGICVKPIDVSSEAKVFIQLSAIENVSNYVEPQLEVTYVCNIGVEDYYGYVNNTIGNTGNSYVNTYNGSLTYINHLTSITNQSLQYDINMVYNSIEKTWKPSFSESITLDNSDGFIRYLWRDPDGTSHSFAPYIQRNAFGDIVYYQIASTGELQSVNNPTVFYPEDDIDYVLTKTTSGDFILRNYDGTQKYFDSSGKLTKFCNTTGDVLYFHYIKQHNNSNMIPRVSSIVCKSADGTITDQIRFDYNTAYNNLCYVYNVQTQMEISIDWLTSWRIESISYNYENQDIYNTIEFAYYSSSILLGSIIDSSAQKEIIYLKDDNNRYCGIEEFVNDTKNKVFTIQYNDNQTIVMDNGTNFESELDDLISAKFNFDKKGRKLTVIEENISQSYAYDDSILPNDSYYSIAYSSNVNYEPYASADEAAIAFAKMYYSSSYYIRHEYGAYIYSCTFNNKTTYNFTNIVYGAPHNVFVYTDTQDQRNFIASIHTHPCIEEFSETDIDNYEKNEENGYLIVPGNILKRYNVLDDSITTIGTYTPITLTAKRQELLRLRFANSWQVHISSNCEYCNDSTLWPNTFNG